MCMGKKESEIETFRRLLKLYPKGILSVVSDTWDLWKVLTEYLPALKKEILSRDGKLVIRPDSGDPVDIICGTTDFATKRLNSYEKLSKTELWKKQKPEVKGVIELLWETFGGTVNELGYKVLDSHIGAIYGDSITLERAKEICERLKSKGFASTNIVLGIGSYTYQYNTRDTFGFAVKATYGEITKECKYRCAESDEPEASTHENCVKECCRKEVECREIFKDPVTDDGTKKSKKGLLCVWYDGRDNTIKCQDQCSSKEEQGGLLTTVFKDGKLIKKTTLDEIRNKLKV